MLHSHRGSFKGAFARAVANSRDGATRGRPWCSLVFTIPSTVTIFLRWLWDCYICYLSFAHFATRGFVPVTLLKVAYIRLNQPVQHQNYCDMKA